MTLNQKDTYYNPGEIIDRKLLVSIFLFTVE